jgi:hypothetical protein
LRVAASIDCSSRASWIVRGLVVRGSVVRDSSSEVRAFDKCGQATKGVWGMSWHQEAMKGVEVCDKPGGVDKQVMIPGFPN